MRKENENEKTMCLPGNIQRLKSTQKAQTSSADTGTKAEVWRNATTKNLLPWASTTYVPVEQKFCVVMRKA